MTKIDYVVLFVLGFASGLVAHHIIHRADPPRLHSLLDRVEYTNPGFAAQIGRSNADND